VARQVRQRVADGTVLDAGCGAGGLSQRLSHLGYKVMAVDRSSAACTLASKSGPRGRRFQVSQGDLTRLMLASNSVDVACYKEVLEHIDNDEAAVRECYRVLRPGGLCVVTVPAHPHLWSQLDKMAGHCRRYTRDGLMELFRRHGFVVEQCLCLGFPMGRLWNRVILPPLVRGYGSSAQGVLSGVLETMLAWELIWQTLSLMFYIDRMFTFTDWGNDFVLMARKPSSREILSPLRGKS
jgi:SAM-dependent methyltransferase